MVEGGRGGGERMRRQGRGGAGRGGGRHRAGLISLRVVVSERGGCRRGLRDFVGFNLVRLLLLGGANWLNFGRPRHCVRQVAR